MNISTKISTVITIIMLIACNSSKQIKQTNQNKSKNFEGKIIYDLTFDDKTGEMTKEQAKMFMGDEQVYTIKEDKYKSEMNGMMKMTQFYLGKDTLYSQIGGMNNLFWIDVNSNPDKLINLNIEEGVETILGIKCDLLTINSEEGITKYYFNKKYKVDPENYSSHEYGFWKLCIEKTNSLPIKSISDSKDIYFEITAKEIKEFAVDNSEFVLPNLPRKKSPEN